MSFIVACGVLVIIVGACVYSKKKEDYWNSYEILEELRRVYGDDHKKED